MSTASGDELARRVEKRNQKPPLQPGSLGPVKGAGSDPITADALYPRWADFIKPNDIVVTETGTSGFGMATAKVASAEGASVIVASSKKSNVDRALADFPSGAEGYVLDITQESAV